MTRPTTPAEVLLTCDEVAERLRTTPLVILRACQKKKLPAVKPFGTWLISEADLAEYVESRRNVA